MGNVPSSYFEQNDEDPFWINDVGGLEKSRTESEKYRTSHNRNSASVNLDFNDKGLKQLSDENAQKLNEFKLELARKHEKRRLLIEEKHKEMEDLREEIKKLKLENNQLKSSSQIEEINLLRKENDTLRALLNEKSSIIEESEIVVSKNHELRINIVEMQQDLQRLNTEVVNFEQEREDYRRHVVALKDVIAVSKNMLQIRESQLKELKEKVETIEQSLADREVTVMAEDLKQEYERQLANMKHLRVLYEERQRAERREKEELASQLDDAKKDIEQQKKKNGELEERIAELEADNSKKYDEIKNLESNLGLSKAENRQYQEELSVINQLFSETLLKYNTSQELDLDKLQKQLEDHHGLLKDIVVNEVSSEVSYALPKVLLELINQLYAGEEEKDEQESAEYQQESSNTTTRHQMNSVEEIVENLPKVWKVLIELLSHQVVPTNVLTDDETSNENPCYKKVETAKGPSLVLSVSQTFIRLKDLILEKKSLEKETSHLKHLNSHLENRLQDQEKRLELVQNELSKTWLVVGKLQKQHQMLHTQEKILRFELAQKRKLLNELKEELEYSREKWTQAREKNNNTEEQWKQLRTEFANRKKITIDDSNNSAESGYSDDREGSSDDEPGYETDVSECDKKNSGEEVEKDLAVVLEEIDKETILKEVSHSSTDAKEECTANNVQKIKKSTKKPGSSSIKENETVYTEKLAEQNICALTEARHESSRVENQTHFHEVANSCNDFPRTSRSLENEMPSSSNKEIQTQNSEVADTSHFLEVKNLRQEDFEQSNIPGEGSTSKASESKPTLEEMLARRDERLKRLEGQATSLVTKVANTASRSVEISNRLDNLHELYGENSENEEESSPENLNDEN